MNQEMKFKRHSLPVGDDQIPVLVAREGDEPKAVFMSYDSFLELTATLYTAVEALRAAGVDPKDLFGDEMDEDVDEEGCQAGDVATAEFASWDDDFEPKTPHLRLVVGG